MSQSARGTERIALLFLLTTLLPVPRAFPQSATLSRTDYLSLGSDHIAIDLNGDGPVDLAGLGTKTAVVCWETATARSSREWSTPWPAGARRWRLVISTAMEPST